MKPSTRWAQENSPVCCQATVREAFEAGARAFAENMPNQEFCAREFSDPYLTKITTPMEYCEEFIKGDFYDK
jgi:hypothetical protein